MTEWASVCNMYVSIRQKLKSGQSDCAGSCFGVWDPRPKEAFISNWKKNLQELRNTLIGRSCYLFSLIWFLACGQIILCTQEHVFSGQPHAKYRTSQGYVNHFYVTALSTCTEWPWKQGRWSSLLKIEWLFFPWKVVLACSSVHILSEICEGKIS